MAEIVAGTVPPLTVTRYVTNVVTRYVTRYVGVVTKFVTFVETTDENGNPVVVKRVVSAITQFFEKPSETRAGYIPVRPTGAYMEKSGRLVATVE